MEPELDNDPNDDYTDPNDDPTSISDEPPMDVDPPAPAHADPAPTSTQPPQQPEPKLIQIPSSSMKRIKEEERQRGRSAVMAELNAEARKLGFQSHSDMVKAIATRRQPGKPAQQATASNEPQSTSETQGSPRKLNALEREVARLNDEKKRQNRRIAELEKDNKRLKAQIDEKDAEIQLRVAAAKSGVQDIEYALHVLRQHLRGKNEQELSGFNEEKFFAETLRNSHPYLYGVETRPATSSPSVDTPPSRPAAPNMEPPVDPTSGPVDARKLDPKQYQELLRKRGITDPSVSSYVG